MGPDACRDERPDDFAELDELARRCGTDKGTQKACAQSPKGYTRHYARYFAPLRERPIRLLEIGIYGGASLKLWEAYFPNARIYGIDLGPQCKRFETPRTKVFIGDQADPGFLREVAAAIDAPLDVVLDDGGHHMHQHQASLEVLFPRLARGGIYAIEDLHTSYWPRYGGGHLKGTATIEFLKRAVDGLHHAEGVGEHESLGPGDPRPDPLPPYLSRLESVHFYPMLAFLLAR